jgi:phosphate transport system substrate-binding protein
MLMLLKKAFARGHCGLDARKSRVRRVMTIFLHSVLLIFILSFVSCKKESKDRWDDTLSSGLIRIACDENFKTLMDAEIRVFEAHYRNAIIIPIYTNETEAIRLLTEDSVRFALTTRDLNSKERLLLKERSMKAQKHLIAFDGIALIANKANADSIIGMPALQKIITGEITEWSQLNPESPFGAIRVIFDNKESGILRYVVDSIVRGGTLSPNLYALNNNLEVIEKVIQMPNTLGLIGINLLSDEADLIYHNYRDQIRLMRISKEEQATANNSYLPYAGDIVQENYPLWRPVYVLLSDPKSGLSSGLSVFLANEIGQKIILKSGLLPITDPQVMPVNIKNEYPK